MNYYMTLPLTDGPSRFEKPPNRIRCIAEVRYFSPLHGDFAVRKVQFGRHSDSARGS